MANNPGGGGGGGQGGGDFKHITNFKFVQEKLEDDPAKRTEQINKIIAQAKAIGSHAYIGFPFEAKNAPFKMRAAAVRKLEVA